MGSGIEALTSEDSIPEGYSEDLVNADPTPEGYLTKRPGFQGKWGHLPVRVSQAEVDGSTLTLTLDASVDLSNLGSPLGSRPLVVSGTAQGLTGDFSATPTSHWYPSSVSDPRVTLEAGTHSLMLSSARTGIGAAGEWVGVLESLSTTDRSNSLLFPDSLALNQSTLGATVTATAAVDTNAYVAHLLPASRWEGTWSAPLGTTTLTILESGTPSGPNQVGPHGLTGLGLQVQLWSVSGGIRTRVQPDAITLKPTGDVEVTVTNNTGSSIGMALSVSQAPSTQERTGTASAASTLTVTLPAGPYVWASCYLELTPGGDRTEVIPNAVTYSASAGTVAITFTNNQPQSATFYIYWQVAQVAANRLTLTQYTASGSPATDLAPQLCVWGLDHSLIYGQGAGDHAGWVTHLDTYRSVGDTFLVAGLGGVLHAGADGTGPLLPALLPNLRARVSGSQKIGPALSNTLDGPQRSEGALLGDNLGALSQAQECTWNPSTDMMRVTIRIHNLTQVGVGLVTGYLSDWLTVQGAGWLQHNGTFPITSWGITPVSPGVDDLWIEVDNPWVVDPSLDDLSTPAQVGVFTSRLSLLADSPFQPGDILSAETFTDTEQVEVLASLDAQVLLAGIPHSLDCPGGLQLAGGRTSALLPLRDRTGGESVTSLVVGDNLSLTGLARELRVLGINPLATQSVGLVLADPDSGLLEVTLSAGTTGGMEVGRMLQITQAGDVSGSWPIAQITGQQTLLLSVTLPATMAFGIPLSGYLTGCTAEVDEALAWSDTLDNATQASVPGRWEPLEAPVPPANAQVPGPYVSYMRSSTYTTQPIVRSTMVTDSLMLTNGVDRPLKVDGSSTYRPGLPRWQAQLFAIPSTGSTGKVVLSQPSCPTTGTGTGVNALTNGFYVAESDISTFQKGARIQRDGDPNIYVVDELYSGTTYQVRVTPSVTAITTASTLRQVTTYSYYFRLNMRDINRNLIASAATGSNDVTVSLAKDSGIKLRLVGMPALDTYDYGSIDLQVYRTKGNGVAPYYLIRTIPLDWAVGAGYIDFTDSTSDDVLTDGDLDPVNTALKGQELGTGWSHAPRAKRVTSGNGRLVLANLVSDPYIDVRIVTTDGAPVTNPVLANKRWLLKRDETDTGTTTDNVDRLGLTWVNAGAGAITGLSSTATTFTVTQAASHGLVAGNWVYLGRASAWGSDPQTQLLGWWQVSSVPTPASFTVNWPDASSITDITLANNADNVYVAPDPRDVPVFIGQDYAWQYQSATLGSNDVNVAAEGMAAIRLASALNAAMRQGVTRPWMVADAGGEFASGQMVLRQSMDTSLSPALVLPSYSGFGIYVDNVLQSSAAQAGAVSQIKGSRLLASYRNFPEIFDSPFTEDDSKSDSAIDVNPADGQDITAIIPFFGDSAFGAALKGSVIVAFKSNSIYLVNLDSKAAGQPAIQKIESMGLGCTAPNSVAPVRNGIMFANESGIYKLNHDLTVYYMGRHLQRQWRGDVNLQALDLAFGHNYAFASQYKLSLPYSGASVPTATLTYNSVREYASQAREGSWTRHEGYTSVGWAALAADSFYAGINGRVMVQRRTGLPQDMRDDQAAISLTATLRSMDFGDEALRKSVPYVTISFRNPPALGNRIGLGVAASTDLSNAWETGAHTVLPDVAERTGTGDYEGQRGITYRYSFSQKKGVRFQLQLVHSTKDENVEVTRVRYSVAGMAIKGIRDGASGPTPTQNSAT